MRWKTAIFFTLAAIGGLVWFLIADTTPARLDGPFDRYIGEQKNTRALGCMAIDLSENQELYLNAVHLTGLGGDLSAVELVGLVTTSEEYVNVEPVLLTHPSLFAPSFAPKRSEIMNGYSVRAFPATLTAEESGNQTQSVGLFAQIDTELAPASAAVPIATLAITIEAVLYEDEHGDRYSAEVGRELALVFSDQPDVNLERACQEVNEAF